MATLSISRPQRKPEYRLSRWLMNLFHGDGYSGKALPKRELITLRNNPNVFIIKEFLTTTELDYIDQYMTMNLHKFEQSHTESEEEEEVRSSDRTSTSTHFPKSYSKVVRDIEYRAAEVAGIGPQCVEQLQLVRYVDGQQFCLHHDAGTLTEDGKVELIPPRRLITIFVYLNSLPAKMGETVFPLLDLSVQPAARDALLLCNLLPNGDPDPRVIHYASIVPAPFEKYGMNIWVNDRDVSTAESSSHTSDKKRKNPGASSDDNDKKKEHQKSLLQRVDNKWKS